jgi:hypothetical protein
MTDSINERKGYFCLHAQRDLSLSYYRGIVAGVVPGTERAHLQMHMEWGRKREGVEGEGGEGETEGGGGVEGEGGGGGEEERESKMEVGEMFYFLVPFLVTLLLQQNQTF